MNDNTRLRVDRHLRLRFGLTKRNKLARAAPLPAYQGIPPGIRLIEVQGGELAVVITVRVSAPAALPVMLTGLVELKLKVGGATALPGLLARAAVRVTLPVKPPVGVTVIVDVLPVVAPGATLTAVPLTVKLGDSW
jgi:hypothetical protein